MKRILKLIDIFLSSLNRGLILSPEYNILKVERQRIFDLYLLVKRDLALLETKIGTPAKYYSPTVKII